MIDLLVDVAVVASAARWARKASVLVWVSFIVASRPSIEIGAARLIARAFGALELTSPVMARATGVMVVCRCSRVWSRIPDLVDLDLGRFKMCGDLFDFWSLQESSQLSESNREVGTWGLLHQLVAHHVKFLFEIATDTVWGIWIPIGRMSGFFIPAMLAVDVLC